MEQYRSRNVLRKSKIICVLSFLMCVYESGLRWGREYKIDLLWSHVVLLI